MSGETDKLTQIKQALEKAIRETAQKETLGIPKYKTQAILTPGGMVDYVIEYIGKSSEPIGLGFRNIRPVNPEDFDDPKFKVRLVHNLALWLKAQAERDK